jgi:heptosyltransferase-1
VTPTPNASTAPPPPSASPHRILIIKPSSLGDVIHALPTVNLIRQHFADAHIAWLINRELAPLLKRCPVIDQIIEFPRRQPSQLPALVRRLRRQRFDLVVDLQGLLRSGLIARLSGAPRRLGLSDAREGSRLCYTEIVPLQPMHAVDRYLLAARHLGCQPGPVEFPLGLPTKTQPPKTQIAINPSARWKTKLWGDDNFAELVRRLPRDRVVLTGSAAERDRIEQIAQGRRNLAGQTDLLELAELYRRCTLLITNDTGPMHLAAAVGTPVVAIFGPTDPALTGPYGKQHRVLRVDIPCSPCLKPHCANPIHMECMKRIPVEQVLAVAKAFLA